MTGKSVMRTLDFGYSPTTVTGTTGWRAGLRLAWGGDAPGPAKYRALDHRRRQAQIRARRALEGAPAGRDASRRLREVG
jgi:hypothetical protein